MSEPEDVLIDAAEHATEAAIALWRRHSADAEDRAVRLEEVQRRLELFLSATFGRDVPLVVSEPPRPPNFFVRWVRDIPTFNVRSDAIPSTDGRRVRLPRRLRHAEGQRERAVARYRLYAVEQTGRILRGTVPYLPDDPRDPAHPLYLLAEALAVDRRIARRLPGLVDDLRRERAISLEARPDLDAMRPPEVRVERLYRRVLDSDPADPPEEIPVPERPAGSREWAESYAADRVDTEPFRGIPAVEVWGTVETEHAPESGTEDHRASRDEDDGERRSRELRRRPKAREPEEDEDDEGQGSWFVPQDDLHETAQDPMGLQRPVDRDDEADPDELAESLAEMPEGRLVRTDDRAREVLASDDPPPRSFVHALEGDVDGVEYPEWDYHQSAYEPGKVVVRPRAPQLGSEAWARGALDDNRGLVREVRRCFEQLRPRRERLRRQPDGPEIDLTAYVEAYGDRAAGRAPEQRLYRAIRPGRREVAVELLVDVSASTDSWVEGQKRVIDVEKVALLIVCEALEALGDRYGITAFSGRGPTGVSTWRLKKFDETYREMVKRRIAGLGPDRYTRTGAALRHAATRLDDEAVRHPLLLLLSDGKPNDLDEYETRYGIEDTRQAVHEARLDGIEVFCLTIDREAPSYMNRIFGPNSFAVLRQPGLLPRVLVDVIRRLLAR